MNSESDTPHMKGVKQVLRNFNLETQAIKVISGGRTNVLYEVETQKGLYMVKVESETSNMSELTQEIMKNLRNRGIIPNQFIKSESSKKYLNQNVLITDKIEGSQFLKLINSGKLNNDDIEKIIRQAIDSGQKISEQKTTGFGRIVRGLSGPLDTEVKYINSSLNRFLENPHIKNNLGDNTIIKIKELFMKNSELFNCSDPRLVYLDFHFRNIIVREKKFQSLIDFDYFVSGDPLLMFARLALRTMENDSDIKGMIKRILDELKIVGMKKYKLRLYTIWIGLVSMFFTAIGEIEGKAEDIRNFKDVDIKEKIELLIDYTYKFF